MVMVTLKDGLWEDSRLAALVTVLVIEWAPSTNGVVGVRVLVIASKVARTLPPST